MEKMMIMRIFLVSLLSVILLSANAQKDNEVPEAVRKSFNKKLPRAENVSWDKVEDNYKADCIFRGMMAYAEFKPDGQWVQTVLEQNPKTLYPPIAKYLKEHFPKDKIIVAEKTIRADKKDYYYIQLEKKIKGRKQPVVLELFFDKTGRLQKIKKPEGMEDYTIPGIDEPDSDVPAIVIEKWQKKFPRSEDIEWRVVPHPNDTVDTAYVAKFVYRGNKLQAMFYPDGRWAETRTRYKEKELYAPVLKYIYENHYDDKLVEAMKVTRWDRKDYYYVKMERKAVFNPIIFELYFDKSGKIQRVDRPQSLKNEYLLTVDIPKNVAKKFKSRFSSAKNVKWESNNGNWIASFEYRGMPTIAEYDDSARWVQTKTEMDLKRIFAPVQRTLDKDYRDYKVTYAEKVTRKDRKDYYYIELIARKRNITPQQLGLYFDKTGRLKEDQ